MKLSANSLASKFVALIFLLLGVVTLIGWIRVGGLSSWYDYLYLPILLFPFISYGLWVRKPWAFQAAWSAWVYFLLITVLVRIWLLHHVAGTNWDIIWYLLTKANGKENLVSLLFIIGFTSFLYGEKTKFLRHAE